MHLIFFRYLKHFLLPVFALFLTSSCIKMPTEPPLHVTTTVLPPAIAKLPLPPPLLTAEEEQTNWGEEYFLGRCFAKDGDYYRAATCFHRSLLLLNDKSSPHTAQLVHALLLTYSLGGKYQEALDLWEKEQMTIHITDEALARDCISLLFEAYTHLSKEVEAARLLDILPQKDALRNSLPLFQTLTINADTSLTAAPPLAEKIGPKEHEEACRLAEIYLKSRKDPTTARLLNGILPGSGYLYVHQYQTAAAAFALNALFIAATCQLFSAHQQAAALISGSFEGGWYLGGITGAGLSADIYNQRLREQLAKPYLERYALFPLQQVRYQW